MLSKNIVGIKVNLQNLLNKIILALFSLLLIDLQIFSFFLRRKEWSRKYFKMSSNHNELIKIDSTFVVARTRIHDAIQRTHIHKILRKNIVIHEYLLFLVGFLLFLFNLLKIVVIHLSVKVHEFNRRKTLYFPFADFWLMICFIDLMSFVLA